MADANAVPFLKRFERAASGCAVSWLAWLIRALPEKTAVAFGVRVGRIIFRLSRKYRERTLSNLRMCFPEWPEERIRTTARRVFEHFCKTTVRFFRADKLSDEDVINSVTFSGFDAFTQGLALGNGVLLITAHFGNWERLAHFLTLQGIKLSVVARDTNTERITELVNSMRTRQGVEVFSRGKAAREMLRKLANNEVVGILPDQNTRELLVPFFGKPAGTNEGPAMIQLRTGARIVMSFLWETDDGNYEGCAYALQMPALSGDKKKDAEEIMLRINEEIENIIRQHPEQWLWLHDRWRYGRELGLIS